MNGDGTDGIARIRAATIERLHPSDWRNPQPAACYGLVVIGAGPAGEHAAILAAEAGARVALVERDLLGGDCLSRGCVPSKALVRSARLLGELADARRLGLSTSVSMPPSFASAMLRAQALRARLAGTQPARRLQALGIDVYFGEACFSGEDSLAVGSATLHFEHALVATGAEPDIPDVPGLVEVGYHSSESIFEIDALPSRLLVLGGGPLGCELAQAFGRFGSRTVIVQDMPLFLPLEERDAAQLLSTAFARDGIEVRLNTVVTHLSKVAGGICAQLRCDDYESQIEVDAILVGTGRVPRLEGLGLEAAGVERGAGGAIRVDDRLCSGNRRIFAAGDACLSGRYTQAAVASAGVAVANALLGADLRMSTLTIPWCTYTQPEIAHVGLYVREAMEREIAVTTYTVLMHQVTRALLDGEETGFVKLHVEDGTTRLLGATIVSAHAGELIGQIALAMDAGIGIDQLAQVVYPYPTQASAIGMAAQAWQRDAGKRGDAGH